jgi:hypothetical protein
MAMAATNNMGPMMGGAGLVNDNYGMVPPVEDLAMEAPPLIAPMNGVDTMSGARMTADEWQPPRYGYRERPKGRFWSTLEHRYN